MAINITSPQTGQIDRTQSSIPVTWTNSDSIYNGHQSSYEIQYKYVADASWSTLGKVTSSAQQGDLKGIFTALGTDAKEIYYRICVRYDLFTSSSLGAKAGGVDYSAVYSIIFRGGNQIGTLKIYDGSAIKEHPVYESVSGQPKLNVRVSGSKTGQVPLVQDGPSYAANIKVALTASAIPVAASAPRSNVSNQYANGYFYGYKYKYSTNYGYYHYISSYYRNYAYRTDSYNSSQKREFRLDRAEYYHYTYYSYAYVAYRKNMYLAPQLYDFISSYYRAYSTTTGSYNSSLKAGSRKDRAGYISYNYTYHKYTYYTTPSATGNRQDTYLKTYYNVLQSYSVYYYRTYSYNYQYVHSYSYRYTYSYISSYYNYSYRSYIYGYNKLYFTSTTYYNYISSTYSYAQSYSYSYISGYYSYISSYNRYTYLRQGSYRYGYSRVNYYYYAFVPPSYYRLSAYYYYTYGTRYYYYYTTGYSTNYASGATYRTSYGARLAYGNNYATGSRDNYSYRWEYAWAYAYGRGERYSSRDTTAYGSRWNYDGRGTGGYSTQGVGSYLQPVPVYDSYTRYYAYSYNRFTSRTYVKQNSVYHFPVYSTYSYYTVYTYSYNFISSYPPVYSYGYFYYNRYVISNWMADGYYVVKRYVGPVYSYYSYYTKYYYRSAYHSSNTTVYGTNTHITSYNDLSYHYKYYRRG